MERIPVRLQGAQERATAFASYGASRRTNRIGEYILKEVAPRNGRKMIFALRRSGGHVSVCPLGTIGFDGSLGNAGGGGKVAGRGNSEKEFLRKEALARAPELEAREGDAWRCENVRNED